jgi:hypothetical protein
MLASGLLGQALGEIEMSQITLQRCRSHNVNSTPVEWETIGTRSNTEAAIAELWSHQHFCRASGDQFRLCVDGRPQVVIDSMTIVDE